MNGYGTGGGKMVTSSEVLSLATPRGATLWKFSLLGISRSMENAFTTIEDLDRAVSDSDAHTKPHFKVHLLLCTYLFILFC